MATLIGLAIYVKLRRSIPNGYKIIVRINSGTHNTGFIRLFLKINKFFTEDQINRQLADKGKNKNSLRSNYQLLERVAAAMENTNLMQTINKCLKPME
jgi:hypothetical protein